MPRPTRIEYNHAFYHVMNRGRGRCNIFHSKEYYSLFLDILSDTNQKFGAIIHAYCLMGNHYHLIIETPSGNLSRIMRHINGVYTQKYNKLKGTDGSLFRGRFKAILIDEDAYLAGLSRYIHKNPIKLVKNLKDYKWSSYRAYLGIDPKPIWLNKEKTLEILGIKNNPKKYEIFVRNDDKFIEDFYGKDSLPAVMGDEDFREKIRRKEIIDTNKSDKIADKLHPQLKLKQIIESVARVFKVKESVLIKRQNGRAKNNFPRKVAMYLCQKYCRFTLKEISEAFNLNNTGSVSKALFDVRVGLSNGSYEKELKEVEGLWLMKRT